MNLIDAIKSGRPLRRQGRATWDSGKGDHWMLPTRDLLADDWETRPPEDENLNARIDHIIRETGVQPTVLDLEPEAFDRFCDDIRPMIRFGWAQQRSTVPEFRGVKIVKGRCP